MNFGHEKATGGDRNREGYFVSSGPFPERWVLPLTSQVRLLRYWKMANLSKVGSSQVQRPTYRGVGLLTSIYLMLSKRKVKKICITVKCKSTFFCHLYETEKMIFIYYSENLL
jgi:hypothetical protein